jgi:hypothetical protein
VAAGFIDFAITWRAEVFAGAPQSSSAASFGTLGITFRAHKPRDEQERAAALAARQAAMCPIMCPIMPGHSRSTSG